MMELHDDHQEGLQTLGVHSLWHGTVTRVTLHNFYKIWSQKQICTIVYVHILSPVPMSLSEFPAVVRLLEPLADGGLSSLVSLPSPSSSTLSMGEGGSPCSLVGAGCCSDSGGGRVREGCTQYTQLV